MEQPEAIRDQIKTLIDNVEDEYQKLKLDNKLLKEKLKQAEFERDEWRKVAER